MKTKEKKICRICKLPINDEKEYAEFIHWWNKKKAKSKAYYHIVCFRDRVLNKEIQEVKEKAMQVLSQIGGHYG